MKTTFDFTPAEAEIVEQTLREAVQRLNEWLRDNPSAPQVARTAAHLRVNDIWEVLKAHFPSLDEED